MKLLHVVGARPNFMKAAPVYAALGRRPGVEQILVHTGQHYDYAMSEVFFQQLGLPPPDVNLDVGSGTHAQQTAAVMSRLEPLLLERQPGLVLVYGDVNSTMAAALVGSKLLVRVAHVEAGLRSRDRTMPEEINRLVTDQLSDLLFTPSADGDENLRKEGVAEEKIHLVGNVMIDTLVRCLPLSRRPESIDVPARYVLVTLHRPSNVDDTAVLGGQLEVLRDLARQAPVLFPVHPRTRQRIADAGLLPTGDSGDLRLMEPLGYLEFLHLQRNAALVVTDSGGIQEETTYLGVPCLTVRENTERPVTVSLGTNVLVGRDLDLLRREASAVLAGRRKKGTVPPLWDGKASERIAEIVCRVEGRP